MSSTAIGVASPSTDAYATTLFVVPRSMPTTYRGLFGRCFMTMARSAASADLDLGGRPDPGAPRQRHARHAPAAMLEDAAKGRLAVHVAGEADLPRVETSRDIDRGAVLLRIDALDAHALMQRAAAAGVNGAYGGADLGVT